MTPGVLKDDHLPFVSIIVACRSIDAYVKECIFESLQLDYPSFELIVLPDGAEDLREARVRVLPTGRVPPSDKRNLGVEVAKGEIIAFIDGDAYPTRDWLGNAVKYFADQSIVAVGGPGLTPESDLMMQQASGEILSSFLGAGPLSFRHSAKLARRSDDLPTVNLIVRRASFRLIGGFDSSCWPGEDTKFCRDLVYGLGKEALYAPDVQVFHHRRRLFRDHLKQIAGYGLHRGYFSKKFPENSRRPLYFVPSAIAIALPTFLLVGYLDKSLQLVSLIPLIVYVGSIAATAAVIGLRRRNVVLAGAVFLGAIATHLCYGAYFIKGLLSKKIDTNTSGYKSNIRHP
jgi:cellulose synthase/poly-beta-1,6-N-acetylglucosamine synthase-like glycosyltransferase